MCFARGFSALQRAENSSIPAAPVLGHLVNSFQCSSASRKFLNDEYVSTWMYEVERFQCSSASRKFLNWLPVPPEVFSVFCFSALQRAENSSIMRDFGERLSLLCFSALQRAENSSITAVFVGALALIILFQCSSASRKFLNLRVRTGGY